MGVSQSTADKIDNIKKQYIDLILDKKSIYVKNPKVLELSQKLFEEADNMAQDEKQSIESYTKFFDKAITEFSPLIGNNKRAIEEFKTHKKFLLNNMPKTNDREERIIKFQELALLTYKEINRVFLAYQ